MTDKLFCYGTLQSREIFNAITGLSPQGEPAWLAGYACYRVKRAVYPGIIIDSQGEVPGTLYRGISRAALQKLDHFEGPLYQRRRLTIISDRGQSIEAWVYVIKTDCRHLLTREVWCYQDHEASFLERFRGEKGSQL